MARKGMLIGTGKKGYHNVIGTDKKVHADSSRGIKQPQRLPLIKQQPQINEVNVILTKDSIEQLKDGNEVYIPIKMNGKVIMVQLTPDLELED